VSASPAHRDRERAESFGAAAAEYDLYRPRYPDALLHDLVGLVAETGGKHVLDIGCGTGIFSRQLANRALRVLGVEIDPKMAAVARAHGVDVDVAPFETWDDAGRRFALVTCAQAWHWLDPDVAIPKIARVLEPAGTLAVFWNYGELDPDIDALVSKVYERVAPDFDRSVVMGHLKDDPGQVEQFRSSGAFPVVGAHTYDWHQDYTASEWVAMVNTHSNHLRLPPDSRAALHRELLAALTTAVGPDGRVRVTYGTYTVLARRPA
jgi:SAM-dependent methyltransferase